MRVDLYQQPLAVVKVRMGNVIIWQLFLHADLQLFDSLPPRQIWTCIGEGFIRDHLEFRSFGRQVRRCLVSVTLVGSSFYLVCDQRYSLGGSGPEASYNILNCGLHWSVTCSECRNLHFLGAAIVMETLTSRARTCSGYRIGDL